MTQPAGFTRTFQVSVIRDGEGMLWGHVSECNCTSSADVPKLKERLTELVLDAHRTYHSLGCSFQAAPSEEELLEGLYGADIVCIEPLTITFE